MTIDPVVVASLSAVAAATAAIWNIVWSVRKSRQERLARLAERQFAWIDDFRKRVSEISVSGNILHGVAGQVLDQNGAALLERTLREIGYVDLMFPDEAENPLTQAFAFSLMQFREQIRRGNDQSQLGELNTAMRRAANAVMKDRDERAKKLLMGKGVQ